MPNNQPMTNDHAMLQERGQLPISHHLSDEIQFLIACCQTDPSKDDIELILSYLQTEAVNFNMLINLANQHGILPLVYKTQKKISEEDSHLNTKDSTLLSDLKSIYIQIAQRNILMSAELIKLMKLLETNGIDALAFKGPTLSQMAYGDITLRQFGDLDILIKRSDLSLIIDLLVEDGYVPELELDSKMKETFISTLNVIGFQKNTSDIHVEIHWELLSKNYAIKWNNNALWDQNKTDVTINNISIPVLPYEEQVLYLCAHGSKHMFERLEWICDIDRSIKVNPNINWGYLLNEADKRGIKRMLYLGLALCQSFFRLELPALLQENIQQDRVLPRLISKVILSNFSESAQVGKDYDYFMFIWNMREKLSDRLRFSWYAFFAPQFDDFNFIKIPKYLAFLYPFVRQFRLVKKYIQR